MDKKNLMYIVGGVAVVGIAYYLYNKKQASKIAPVTAPATAPASEVKSEDESLDADPTMTTDPLQGKPATPSSTMPVSATTTATTTAGTIAGTIAGTTAGTIAGTTTPRRTLKLNKFQLEKRMLKLCGVRPPFKGGARNNYNMCLTREKDKLRAKGFISFNNTYSNMSSDFDVSFR
jgi:hypothetical protein